MYLLADHMIQCNVVIDAPHWLYNDVRHQSTRMLRSMWLTDDIHAYVLVRGCPDIDTMATGNRLTHQITGLLHLVQ